MHKLILGICFLLGSGSLVFAADEQDPASELASFQMADGFEANLFASEKDGVVKPIQIRFDARGRIWVIGSSVYPQIEPGQIPNDKVLILEDTDQDGRCDKVTVFADGLMIPTGIELADGGAYVAQGTELLFLKDTDGDGKADERRVVLRGFGTGDNHQNINSFFFGPGGELWMCQGLHIFSNVETPWGIVRLHKAGLWRFRPKLKKLEGFYGSEHEPQNPWGYVFTDWGEPIVIAGNNSSPIYPVPGLVVDHLDLPPALLWKNGQGRKSSGADIVGTAHFPESWQGVLVTGGYINNAVWALKIIEDGSGFALEDLPPLVRPSSRNFRPVDVKFGPDGALYIADWYNPIIGHYQASFRDPNRDKTHGRIWRITAKGRPLTKPPHLADASVSELLDELKSPDRWTRRFAKRVLADRPAREVVPALSQFLGVNQRDETHPSSAEDLLLKEILGVCQSHETPNPELLERLCRASDPGARAYAASAVGSWADHLQDPLSLLRPLANDPGARVRLQSIVASTYVHSAEAIQIALMASDHPADKFIDYALKQAIHALKPYWLGPFKSGSLPLSFNHLLFLVKTDGTADILGAVRELWQNQDLDQANRNGFILALIETGDANDLEGVLKRSKSFSPDILTALGNASRARGIKPSGDVETPVRSLLNETDTAFRARAAGLVGIWKIEPMHPLIEELAFNKREPIEVRVAALDSLANFAITTTGAASRLDSSLKQNLLGAISEGPAPLRDSAFSTLLSLYPAGACEAAAAASSTRADWDWEPIFSAILRRQGAAKIFARALESASQPPAREAAETGLRVMNSSGRRNEALAAILSKAAGSQRLPRSLENIPDLAREVRDHGEAKRGEAVFRRLELGCLNCHAVLGQGGKIGPDLSALGTAQPIDFIIGAILDPQKEIKEGYISTFIATKNGDEFQGYIARETGEEIVLRDLLQNKEVRLPRPAIAERKAAGSAMPSGLTDALTDTEFSDLIRYLSGLGQTGDSK